MSGNTRSVCLLSLLITSLVMLLSGCGSSGGGFISENRSNRGYNAGVGPFDSRGNYVERWADDKSKGRQWRKSSASGDTSVAANQPTPPVAGSNTTPGIRLPGPRITPPVGSAVAPTPRAKPRPKPTVKVKPKRKPPIRHTVKKGDTLWGISRKYKTSVTAIQRANGLKGTNLKIGRRLLIPRY